MKILLLADLNSPHTIKWATALTDRGHEIAVFGIHAYTTDVYDQHPHIKIFSSGRFQAEQTEGSLKKLAYLKTLPALKNAIKVFIPDIIHAHYASSYGFLGALTGFQPLLLSVWGSDVASFPSRSPLHRLFIRWILTRADSVLATSSHLADQVQRLAQVTPKVVPFGVDLDRFKPDNKYSESIFTFGTAKNFVIFSGIDTVIHAFGELGKKYPDKNIRLLIAGEGPEKSNLEQLVQLLDLGSRIQFVGPVAPVRMPEFFNRLSVYINVPDRESFGVAVLEALATELPVIVSNVGGLTEIVKPGETGFLVPPRDPNLLAEQMEHLLLNPDICCKLGRNGRAFVGQYFNWDSCVDRMEEIYHQILDSGFNN